MGFISSKTNYIVLCLTWKFLFATPIKIITDFTNKTNNPIIVAHKKRMTKKAPLLIFKK